jgi:hypothetical protein
MGKDLIPPFTKCAVNASVTKIKSAFISDVMHRTANTFARMRLSDSSLAVVCKWEGEIVKNGE